MTRIILFAVPALAVIATLPARAEMFGPCGKKTSTLAVVEWVQEKTNVADQRLNAAYKALQAQIDANQRQPLLAAQRHGSNTGTRIAPSTERKTDRFGRCKQPNAYAQ